MEGDGKVRRLRQACVDEYAQRVDEPLGRGMGTVAVTGDVRALSMDSLLQFNQSDKKSA
jgi:hypothetical protein